MMYMQKIKYSAGFLIFISVFLLSSCGTIETGNIGVRTSWTGKISKEEVQPGFYVAVFSSVMEFSAREITVELTDMMPKAKDNLTLADMDVEIFYTAKSDSIADITIKYADRNARSRDAGIYYPGYYLIRSIARETTYSAVALYNSLEVHKERENLKKQIEKQLQNELDKNDPGTFEIKKVIIRNIKTDSSVENAIKMAVAKEKELEAAKKEVEIAIEKSKAYTILNRSLSKNVLEQKRIEVLKQAVDEGKAKMIILGNGGGTPLINLPN